MRVEARFQHKEGQRRGEVALIRRATAAMDIDHYTPLFAGSPHWIVSRRMQRFDPATWRHARKQDTARKTMVRYPVDVTHSLVDVVQENLSYASSASWKDHAPLGQPSVVSTQTGQTQRVVSCSWCGRHQATRWEERRNSVREYHLTYDPIGLVRRLTYIRVPIAI